MKYLVIGGSGFVGTKLIGELQKLPGATVVNLDKRQSSNFANITTIADITDLAAVEHHFNGVDVVYLLAAEHTDNVTPVSLYYDVNVGGMKVTLGAMARHNVNTLVFISSVAIYGIDKENPTEDSPAQPFNDYGKSKWESEQVLHAWCNSHSDFSALVLRPTVIFGEGNRGNVFNLLKQIASGRFVMIGKGNNRKSMSYIWNVVNFILYMVPRLKPGYNVYNYVDKPDLTTNDLVRWTSKVLGRKIPVLHVPYWMGMMGGYVFDGVAKITGKKLAVSSVRIKKFCAVTQFDGTKVEKTGYKPVYTLQDGLARTLAAEFEATHKA